MELRKICLAQSIVLPFSGIKREMYHHERRNQHPSTA